MHEIPSEVVAYLRQFLPPAEDAVLARVSRRFYDPESVYVLSRRLVTSSLEMLLNFVKRPEREDWTFEHAAAWGNLDLLKWLYSRWPSMRREIAPLACSSGNIEMVDWIEEQGILLTESCALVAADHGHFDLLRHLYSLGCAVPSMCAAGAAKYGRIDVLEWMGIIGVEKTDSIATTAAGEGNIDVLEWAWENRYPFSKHAFARAVKRVKLEAMEWLYNHGCISTDTTLPELIFYPENADALQWMISKRLCNRPSSSCSAAAVGHIPFLEMYLAEGTAYTVGVAEAAVRAGNLKSLEWLHSTGTILSSDLYHAAMGREDAPEIFDWLFERGCPLDTWLMGVAIDYGNVEAVEWLLGKELDFNEDIYRAVSSGSIPMIEWFREIGHDLDPSMYSLALGRQSSPVVEWLYREGVRFPEGLCNEALEKGMLATMEWMVRRGAEPGDSLCENLLCHGHVKLKERLHSILEFADPMTASSIEIAIEYDRPEIIQWLGDSPYFRETFEDLSKGRSFPHVRRMLDHLGIYI